MKYNLIKKNLLILVLTTLIGTQTLPITTFANISNNDDSIHTFTRKDSSLLHEKEKELEELSKEFNLNEKEIQDLRDLYNEYTDMTVTREKLEVITKILKVCQPVMVKATKLFEVTFTEKSLCDLYDYLIEWQDDLENGIKNFLINKYNWNQTAANWTAKSIMFIIF